MQGTIGNNHEVGFFRVLLDRLQQLRKELLCEVSIFFLVVKFFSVVAGICFDDALIERCINNAMI